MASGSINNRELGPLSDNEIEHLARWARTIRKAEERGEQPKSMMDADSEMRARAFTVLCLLENVSVMRTALEEIAKGMGAYSRDQLTFAENVIEESKRIASAALRNPAVTNPITNENAASGAAEVSP